MKAVIFQDFEIWVPGWVVDLDSFHRWVDSDDVPEKVRIDYLQGEIWIDSSMSEEQVFTHVRMKTELNCVLALLGKTDRQLIYLTDGLRIENSEVGLSAVPDGTLILRDSLRTGQVRLIPGMKQGYVRLEGSPDLVIEVVSDGSVRKDMVLLREQYWLAGIREYWLIDVRGDRPLFDIFRHGNKGYVAARKQAGWVKSSLLKKSFRLTQEADADGYPEYNLTVR